MGAKQKAEKRGRWAEHFAAFLLQLKGYSVLSRREKQRTGEIDLIVKKGPSIIAVEVKYRQSAEDALYAINARQKKRIENSLLQFAKTHKYQDYSLRFDVIVVAPGQFPKHIKNAWRPEVAF